MRQMFSVRMWFQRHFRSRRALTSSRRLESPSSTLPSTASSSSLTRISASKRQSTSRTASASTTRRDCLKHLRVSWNCTAILTICAKTVCDAKTTKQYAFGNYQKKWQRYTYPFTLIESGMMNNVNLFEFTVYVLKGGSSRTPLITGTQYREVYTYDHEQARTMLTQQCERLIEFLEENRSLITNDRIFGKEQ